MRPKLIWKENGAAICHLGNKLYGIVICGQLLIPIMMHEMSLEIVLTCEWWGFCPPLSSLRPVAERSCTPLI